MLPRLDMVAVSVVSWSCARRLLWCWIHSEESMHGFFIRRSRIIMWTLFAYTEDIGT
jgi:hypothetical protein